MSIVKQIIAVTLVIGIFVTLYKIPGPEKRILYHGTSGELFASIVNTTLDPKYSRYCGNLGRYVVYFTDTYEQASILARHRMTNRPGSNGMVVFKCDVLLGKTYNSGTTYKKTWKDNGYDSASGRHPNMPHSPQGFNEWAVKDSKNIRIIEATVIGANINEDINAPQLILRLKNATIDMTRNVNVKQIIYI